MTLDEALRAVAAHIFSEAARDVKWDSYPDIGEGDLFKLCNLLDKLAPVDAAAFDAAYAYLTERAAGIEA